MNSARPPSTRDVAKSQSPEPARDADVEQGQNSTFTANPDSQRRVCIGDRWYTHEELYRAGAEWWLSTRELEDTESAPAESGGVAVLRQDSPDAPTQHKGLAYPASAGADVVPSTRPVLCEACRIYDVGVAAERERCARICAEYAAELLREKEHDARWAAEYLAKRIRSGK